MSYNRNQQDTYCQKCNRSFKSSHALLAHMASSGRHLGWCTFCRYDTGSRQSLEQHQRGAHANCDACAAVFEGERGKHEHARQKHLDRYCVGCQKMFGNSINLDAHLSSSIHQPANMPCPGQGCSRSFIDHSAIILHLESGTCVSGMNIHELNQRVIAVDRSNFITNPNRLIEYGGGGGGGGGSNGPFIATEDSYDHSIGKYCCPLCSTTCRLLPHLNNHLNSPRHSLGPGKIYRCPTTLNGCNTQFGQLSALVQHMEKGNCGVRRFKEVANQAGRLLGSAMNGRGTIEW